MMKTDNWHHTFLTQSCHCRTIRLFNCSHRDLRDWGGDGGSDRVEFIRGGQQPLVFFQTQSNTVLNLCFVWTINQ